MSGKVTVLQGDAAHLPLPDASVDAVVCDPPYGLAELPAALVIKALTAWLGGDREHVPSGAGFMGREWDRFVPPPAAWDECLRVLRPGGHLLAFASPRTQDLMGLSIRLAGFEIREGFSWVFSQGMPKSLNVSKAINRAAGADREVVGTSRDSHNRSASSWQADDGAPHGMVGRAEGPRLITAPATEDAVRWEGWGTATKPAHEPVIMARKPLEGSVAANVIEHGTGAINVRACQVGAETRTNNAGGASSLQRVSRVEQGYRPTVTASRSEASEVTGRWPANVVFSHAPECVPAGMRRVRNRSGGVSPTVPSSPVDAVYGDRERVGWQAHGDADGVETVESTAGCVEGCPVAELDAQSGNRKAGSPVRGTEPSRRMGSNGIYGSADNSRPEFVGFGDEGGASRFFPVFRYEAKASTDERPRLPDGTAWPTVKPLELIRWLARLVTRPGGTILDPFCGTGTLGQAAMIEGFDAILLDKDPQAIALTRVRLAKPVQPVMFDPEPATEHAPVRSVPKLPVVSDVQGDLFDLGEAS